MPSARSWRVNYGCFTFCKDFEIATEKRTAKNASRSIRRVVVVCASCGLGHQVQHWICICEHWPSLLRQWNSECHWICVNAKKCECRKSQPLKSKFPPKIFSIWLLTNPNCQKKKKHVICLQNHSFLTFLTTTNEDYFGILVVAIWYGRKLFWDKWNLEPRWQTFWDIRHFWNHFLMNCPKFTHSHCCLFSPSAGCCFFLSFWSHTNDK